MCFFLCILVTDIREEIGKEKAKEPEKKPNILRDYACLRDGDLCHPEYGRNRGLYVSCSNGVAWEQTCPKCAFHPLNCPTRSLWFDGEKCEWASPKLASGPCLDRFPQIDGKDEVTQVQSAYTYPMPDQASRYPGAVSSEKGKWQVNQTPVQLPVHFKSPKYDESEREPEADEEVKEEEVKEVVVEALSAPEEDEVHGPIEEISTNTIQRKSQQVSEIEFPSFLNTDDSLVASKIIKLSDPVYTLVNNPDGSGKQVFMRISQPFVLEDNAPGVLSSMNILGNMDDKY